MAALNLLYKSMDKKYSETNESEAILITDFSRSILALLKIVPRIKSKYLSIGCWLSLLIKL